MRFALFIDIIGLAFDTLRSQKMRSVLTILGIVISITAIVGMTSLIRGLEEALRDQIRELGPDTIFVAKFSGVSVAAGKDLRNLIKRPVITVEDARAIERDARSVGRVDIWLGAGMPERQRIHYKGARTKDLSIIGVSENYAARGE